MVARIAEYEGVRLPQKFWNTSRWKRTYLLQVTHANNLLKLYSIDAIIAALRTKEGKKVRSFGAKWLDPIVQDEQERIDRQKALAPEAHEIQMQKPLPDIVEPPRPLFVPKKSLLSKLRDLNPGPSSGHGEKNCEN